MQRGVTPASDDSRPACARCGGALVRSHREYAGRGASRDVLRCRECGATVTRAARVDADRPRDGGRGGRSRRHQPFDEGSPANPVLDAETARRLLEGLSES